LVCESRYITSRFLKSTYTGGNGGGHTVHRTRGCRSFEIISPASWVDKLAVGKKSSVTKFLSGNTNRHLIVLG